MSEHDDSTEASESPPQSPKLGRLRKKPPTKLHAFGDIHGWAPGLITYLISHKLASISIDDKDLGSDGSVDEGVMAELFGRPKDGSEPSAGLRGSRAPPQRCGWRHTASTFPPGTVRHPTRSRFARLSSAHNCERHTGAG